MPIMYGVYLTLDYKSINAYFFFATVFRTCKPFECSRWRPHFASQFSLIRHNKISARKTNPHFYMIYLWFVLITTHTRTHEIFFFTTDMRNFTMYECIVNALLNETAPHGRTARLPYMYESIHRVDAHLPSRQRLPFYGFSAFY